MKALKDNHMEGNLIVGEQLIHYLKEGQAEKTVLLLHGWGQHAATFGPLMRPLAASGISCIALDLPGFGKSQLPKHAFSVSDYAEVVMQCIAKLKLPTPLTFAGHSFGGRIGIYIAATHPALVEKLILIDSAGVAERGTPQLNAVRTVAKIGNAILSLPGLSKLREGARKKFHRAVGAEDYTNAGALKETFVKVIEEDLSPLLPKISCKTQIIWGADDAVTPLAEAEKLHSLITHSELAVIENAGHFSYLDAPEKFLNIFQNAVA